MNYLKITSKGWNNYTGQLNIITFKNGVSTEPVTRLVADRIAASVNVVTCDENGNVTDESESVGVQHRLVAESASRAPVAQEMKRQTEDEKRMEAKLDAARALTAPTDKLYTKAELEAIADESGIKGLRVIGEAWAVKARAIPDLIELILVSQTQFIERRNAVLEKTGDTVLKATTIAEDEVVETFAPLEVFEVKGFEGMPGQYLAPGDVLVPAETVVNAALKNSGRTLTGWNNERDHIRREAIEVELAALARYYGADLVAFVPDAAPEQKSSDEQEQKSSDKQEQEPESDAGAEGEVEGKEGDEQKSDEPDADEGEEDKGEDA